MTPSAYEKMLTTYPAITEDIEPLGPRDLLRMVCESTGYTPKQIGTSLLGSGGKTYGPLHARIAYINMCVRMFPHLGAPVIAQVLGCDHSTILHAISRRSDEARKSKFVEQTVSDIDAEIERRKAELQVIVEKIEALAGKKYHWRERKKLTGYMVNRRIIIENLQKKRRSAAAINCIRTRVRKPTHL